MMRFVFALFFAAALAFPQLPAGKTVVGSYALGAESLTTANRVPVVASAGALGQSDVSLASGIFSRAGTLGLSATNIITWSTNGSERGRWSSGGNLLIGTTTDGNYRLDVQSSGSTGTMRVYDQTATTGVTSLVVRAGAGQSTTALQTWQNNAGTTLATIGGTGWLLDINTAGSSGNGFRLVRGTNEFGGYQVLDGASYLGTLTAKDFNLVVNSAVVMTLNSSGYAQFATGTRVGFFGVTPAARASALTAADASALNTGDATSDTVIGNMRTRIAELETKLQAYGLLQ